MATESLIHIVTGNCEPFRLVLRDGDKWDPSLEAINDRTYDYVKLCRLSLSLNIGIEPFGLGVCFDGTFFLPALPQYRERPRAVEEFNAALSRIVLGGVYCEAVSPADVGASTMSHAGYTMFSCAKGASARFHAAARMQSIAALDVMRLYKPETIRASELASAYNKGKRVLDKLPSFPSEIVLYASSHFVRHQWSECLIHAWTLSERLIEIAWAMRVVPPNVDRARRDFLQDQRAWTSATKLEVLLQIRALPEQLVMSLNVVRKARNRLVHDGKSPDYSNASMAIRSMFELLSMVASDFVSDVDFEDTVELVTKRSRPELFPQEEDDPLDPTHFLELPPVPGFSGWSDDEEYEVIESLRVKRVDFRDAEGSGDEAK
ncbi:MAG: hypothetical protein KDC95_14425 [Planctomycetes bacterium]|nr:hypothetical protein [Planctomycetota bacterium]